jgi:hypothetical protein
MSKQSVSLIDKTGAKVATLEVAPDRDCYRGTICLDVTPPELQQLFAEFEECVEGQMFAHADEVEAKIAAIPLRVVFPNSDEAEVVELQVYPSTKRVSFKTRSHTGRPHPICDDPTPIKELV